MTQIGDEMTQNKECKNFSCIKCKKSKRIEDFTRGGNIFKSCNKCHDGPTKIINELFNFAFGILDNGETVL